MQCIFICLTISSYRDAQEFKATLWPFPGQDILATLTSKSAHENFSYFSFSLESENPSHAWYLLYFSVHRVHGVDRTQGPQGSRRTNITVSQVLLPLLHLILKRMCSKVSAEIWRRERRLSAHSEGLFENRVWEKNTTPWYSLCQTINTRCNNDHTCQIEVKIREES